MLHVRDLPVVKIAQLLIFSENDYMYFIFVCQVVGWGTQPFKNFLNNCKGLVVLFAVSCPAFSGLFCGG